MAKKRPTNRDLLEGLAVKVDTGNANLTKRIDGANGRVDSIHKRIDDLHTSFDDHCTEVNKQFTNHLETHDKLNKRLLKGGLVVIGLIVIAVGFNNLPALIRWVTLAVRWV